MEAYNHQDSLRPFASAISNEAGLLTLSKADELSHIILQHLSYKTRLLKAPFSPSQTITLTEASHSLEALEVLAKRPVTRITAEGFSYTPNKKQLLFNSLEQYLSKLPFVSASNGEYSVMGKGKASIYLNGRKISDLSELNTLNMDDVLSVDVLTNPGGRYDADIPAVIEIKTKRAKQHSFTTEVRGGISYGTRWSHDQRISVAFATPTLSLKSLAMYDTYRSCNDITMEQAIQNPSPINIRYNSQERQTAKPLWVRSELIFSPSPKHTLGLLHQYGTRDWDNELTHKMTVKRQLQQQLEEQRTLGEHNRYNNKLSGYYTLHLGQFTLEANADYYHGRRSGAQSNLLENHPNSLASIGINSAQQERLYYGQLQTSYKPQNYSLSLGIDLSDTKVSQSYHSNNHSTGLSDSDTHTTQLRFGSYLEGSAKLGQWMLRAGVRYEHLNMDRAVHSSNGKQRLFGFGKLFPHLSVATRGKGWQAQAGYKMYTSYPSYSALSSEIRYSSPYLYEGGNPNLHPEEIHDLSLLVRYHKLSSILSYKLINDDITQVPLQFSPEVLLYQSHNRGQNRYLSLGLSYKVDWSPSLETTFESGARHQWLNVPEVQNNGYSFRLSANSIWAINKHLQLYADLSYTPRSRSDLYIIQPSWQIDAGLSLSLLENKLHIGLDITDMFSTQLRERTLSTTNILISQGQYAETRYCALSIRYRVQGKFKTRSYDKQGAQSEINRF